MCRLKSCIVLENDVFMPNYNSHTEMLEELGIADTQDNASNKFVRVEIYPKDGNAFTDVKNWIYGVDQDILPYWYDKREDERRAREKLSEWAETMFKYYNKRTLGEILVGETFKIGNIEYVVLNQNADSGTTECISVGFINEKMRFDDNSSDFKTSDINKYLNTTYLNWLSGEVGDDNIVQHDVDLTSYDNDTQYGTVACKISLLTLEQYKRYKGIIPKADNWWWLATPYSPKNYRRDVCYVYSNGDVYGRGFRCGNNGVRPFCIFKSSLFVSCK